MLVTAVLLVPAARTARMAKHLVVSEHAHSTLHVKMADFHLNSVQKTCGLIPCKENVFQECVIIRTCNSGGIQELNGDKTVLFLYLYRGVPNNNGVVISEH